MATYLLFSFATYYPEGGADDFVDLVTAADDEAALYWALGLESGIDDRWHLAKLSKSKLEPVFEGFGDGDGRIAASTAIPATPLGEPQ